MQSLEQLYIAGNGLKGNLQIFELWNLRSLNIRSNRFTGTLSSNISHHVFEVFDISSNQITGYLNTYIDAKQTNKTNEYFADTNRLSGALNSEAIDNYRSVEVLSGNSISCNTLPRNDVVYTSSVLFSFCETRPVFFSIIIWCISLGVALLLCAINYKRVTNELLSSKLWCVDSKITQSPFPCAVHVVVSLQKLYKLVLISSLFTIVVLVVIYSGFEFNQNSNTDYKVLSEKYDYAFSGVYLKSVYPAVVLFLVFTIFSVILVFTVHRIFLIEWAVVPFATIIRRPQEDSMSMESRFIFIRYLLLVLFLVLSLLINVAYVYELSENVYVLALQIAFFICNSLYRFYGTAWILSFLNSNAHLTKLESALFHTIILTFICIINPCLATLIIDTHCFREYFFGVSNIDASYSFKVCSLMDTNTLACSEESVLEVRSILTPPYIYGHQCRNAVFGNYIPVVLLSCAFNTFVYPFVYTYLTNFVQSLSDKTVLFSYLFDSRSLVLEVTLVHAIEGIIFDLVLMVLFGIVYPLCFVFLVLDITSQVYLLIRRLHLYIELYQRTKKNNLQVDKENVEYLENMVGDAIPVAPYIIWPGLGAASVIFGMYIFDMAWDSKGNDIGVPITVLVLTLTAFAFICIIFFKAKSKLIDGLSTHVDSHGDERVAAATTNNRTSSISSISHIQHFTRSTVDGTELASTTTSNPIF
jgi:hypothetical protein